MNRSGFSLIELIVVIAIMAVLTGVAVPYYQDSIMEARRNTLKSNLATLRQVLNQFRGDQRRGPVRIATITHNPDIWPDGVTVTWDSNNSSELVQGPVQYLGGKWQRRTNIKYLPTMPDFDDPADGSRHPATWTRAAGTYFIDANGDSTWDIKTEPAWQPLDFAGANASGAPTFRNGTDTMLVNVTGNSDASYFGSQSKPLDIVEVIFKSNDGTIY